MDDSVPDIRFNEEGCCNYCENFIARSTHIIHEDPVQKKFRLKRFIERVRATGKGNRYDCVVGVSGGVDSSWSLVQAVRLGLRPLALHLDNGWNSEQAQSNIANLVDRLGVDLYTHVVDWDEYRALMQAFFDSDVIDVELLSDNAACAANYEAASRFGVNFILAGTNQATEGMAMPITWNWFKLDRLNIKSIARNFGPVSFRTYPSIGVWGYWYFEYVKKIRWVSFLDFFEFNKFEAIQALRDEFNYKPYPFKHYESIFTRFYQAYILPRKFGVDKRLLHLSTLVVSGQMSRDDALSGLEGVAYPSNQALDNDIQFFIKKMGWSRANLDAYISRPEVGHRVFASEKWLLDLKNSASESTPKVLRDWIRPKGDF